MTLPAAKAPPLSLLVVDDSAVVRKMLFTILAGREDINLVGQAANGDLGLTKIRTMRPDVVLLDLEMPVRDGFAVLSELKSVGPEVDVIVLSAHTRRGAIETIEALTLGALDYLAKPEANDSLDEFSERLLKKLDAVRVRKSRRRGASGLPGSSGPLAGTWAQTPVQAIALGASTGGPMALQTVCKQLPRPLLVPVLIVQHMPDMFTQPFAQSLATRCDLPVREAQQGESPRPGHVYIAPGGSHLRVRRVGASFLLGLDSGEPRQGCRPSVDVLFESVAQAYGSHASVALLTGMGRDGVDGCRAVREAGGSVIAQDEATSVVWGMPGAAVERGLPHVVLPLGLIGAALPRDGGRLV